MTRKSFRHFPDWFCKIAPRTIRLETWEYTFPLPSNANSMRTSWYIYAAALKAENQIEAYSEAARVIVRVVGCKVLFQDRNFSPVSEGLAALLFEDDNKNLKQLAQAQHKETPTAQLKTFKELTEDDKIAIKNLLSCDYSEALVAESFGVDVATIQQVREKEAS